MTQLLKDYEDVNEVNAQLEKMGFSIGERLVDELLAKAPLQTRCSSFKEAAEIVGKVGFKMFLGVSAEVGQWNAEGTSCSITLKQNPLTDFVELPENMKDLKYCSIFAGCIRGALEMVRMEVKCTITRETLKGDSCDEILVEFVQTTGEEMDESYGES